MENKLPAWDDLRVLLEVHRQGSFLEAGLQLGLSTSTVARRIGALEKDLGRALVHRTSRGALLEKEALELIALAENFEQALRAHRRDSGPSSPYAGRVRVSLPDGFMTAAAEAAARFRRWHPETHIEVISELRFVDLTAREADIGVRGGRSSSPVLIEKPMGDILPGLYASTEYLARALPSRFLGDGDYARQDFIVEDENPRGQGASQWLTQRGASRFPFRSNSLEARLHAAKCGMGLVLLGLGAEREHPELIRVGLATPLPGLRFYLTMHKDLRRVPRIRGVALALQEVFAEYFAAQAQVDARARRDNSRPKTR
ncbi:LysR family transcriptional regulator [Pyxidicoccus parkwayensis]|uniref:LysR family transcriptional regulator n=1 Tax=Pyxidicoccus parkwayensis TaxID=2813578 RepID=A0ABX7P8R5_9BACT|nr:LysR family transcriptional regulator [Pyxidicoccus parkwaysis]QSQ26834.1 LysR family transcriptional regulator [Pyxidicoccus parkwaysis]